LIASAPEWAVVSVVPPPYAFVVVTIIIAFDKIGDWHPSPVNE
jgi:hypothetical protein